MEKVYRINIEEHIELHSADVRKICIKNNYFNIGDNKEYEYLLSYIEEHSSKKVTTADLTGYTDYILGYTDLEGMKDDELWEQIYCDLYHEAVRRYVVINREYLN